MTLQLVETYFCLSLLHFTEFHNLLFLLLHFVECNDEMQRQIIEILNGVQDYFKKKHLLHGETVLMGEKGHAHHPGHCCCMIRLPHPLLHLNYLSFPPLDGSKFILASSALVYYY